MSEPEPQIRPKPTRDPQALTSEYHKARKQLMLWAGILFIWELVGIDLEKAKEVGGNAGAIITAIKSPQAIPWVLVVLVAYFVFKLGVEWNQCEARRRQTLASRVDVGSAWVVAFLACALYAYQSISRIQVADVVQTSEKFKSSAIGIGLGASLSMLVSRLFKLPLKPLKWFSAYIWGFTFLVLIMWVPRFFVRTLNLKYGFGTAVLVYAVTGVFSYLAARRRELGAERIISKNIRRQNVSSA